MADPKKVSFAQFRVGVMAIVAMVIIAVLIFLLTGSKNLFTRTFELRTFMDDSSGMPEGATVRLNGILVGDVARLKLSGSSDPHRIVAQRRCRTLRRTAEIRAALPAPPYERRSAERCALHSRLDAQARERHRTREVAKER